VSEERPHILVLGHAGPAVQGWLGRCHADAAASADWEQGLARLDAEPFDAVLIDASDDAVLSVGRDLLQARRVLAAVPDGVALVDFDLRVRWCNPAFAAWCGGSPAGRGFYEALGSPAVTGPADYCPFHTALAQAAEPGGPPVRARLSCVSGRYLDLHITPLLGHGGRGPLLVVAARDVTRLVQQEQKLEALHQAGRELAALSPDQLAEMSVAERIDLLRHNIRRLTTELLGYQSVEVRLLDRRTGVLEPLVQVGMAPDAAARVLRADEAGHGVTGHVAATGRPYLCRDIEGDPLYLPGAPGARSSLTVPLLDDDRVVGTLNVESPRPDAFGEDDLRFAELFAREVANALHTLELLSAEQQSAAGASVDAVSREVALPVDEILAAAGAVLERYIGHDAEMAAKLRTVLTAARSIKAAIAKVGEEVAPARPAPAGPTPVPPDLKGLRVLVADSDERVRRTAHGLLGRWGCIVETARDSREALTMARLGAYDAVLMDIRPPDASGYETYCKLRQAQPQARVVLMTEYGYDPGHTIAKARQDGLKQEHILFKPFRVDQLLRALATPQEKASPV
jgi:CheY-like chemotaxis protein/PAS domain-containing protein